MTELENSNFKFRSLMVIIVSDAYVLKVSVTLTQILISTHKVIQNLNVASMKGKFYIYKKILCPCFRVFLILYFNRNGNDVTDIHVGSGGHLFNGHAQWLDRLP